jgi:hypothetical protein
MRNKSVKRHKIMRWSILLPLAAVVVVAAAAVVLIIHHNNSKTTILATAPSGVKSTDTVNYSAPSKSDNNASENNKSTNTPSQTLDQGSATTSGGSTSSFSVSLTANNNSGNVHVGTLIDGATSGSCTLTASKSGSSDIQLGTASVSDEGNYYWCGVFNISTSQFPSSGTWQLTLNVDSNGSQGSGSTSVDI